MTAITAKPITATPITARPLTAYRLGESTSTSNDPLRWPPEEGISLYVDFESDRYYWGGEVKTIDDFTEVESVGLYILDDLDLSGEATVLLEYVSPEGFTPSGTAFAWTSGYPSGSRMEWYFTSTTGQFLYAKEMSPSANSFLFQNNSIEGELSKPVTGNGRHRVISAIASGLHPNKKADNGQYYASNESYSFNTIAAPTKVSFNARAWNPTLDAPLTNINLKKVVVYNSVLSEAKIHSLGASGIKPPVHLIGDSFLNNYMVLQQLRLITSDAGYIGYSQDAVGASSLTDQATRFANNGDHFHDATLVICDFGMDTNVADSIAAIDDMVSRLTHNRWLYMEPAPNIADGEAARDTFDAKVAALADHCGGRFVPTLAPALLAGDDSPEDNAEIAKNLWPLSLKTSVADFHPSEAGREFLAGVIHDALVAKGWA